MFVEILKNYVISQCGLVLSDLSKTSRFPLLLL